jgi:hypothetical protein
MSCAIFDPGRARRKFLMPRISINIFLSTEALAEVERRAALRGQQRGLYLRDLVETAVAKPNAVSGHATSAPGTADDDTTGGAQ